MQLDLSRSIYLYGQALDNSGDVEYWCTQDGGHRHDKLESTDGRLRGIRHVIDEVLSTGRLLPISTTEFECRATLDGSCVVVVRPVTKDADGRVSPVLMLFSLYSGGRHSAIASLRAIPAFMGRELSIETGKQFPHLGRLLNWPRPLIFFALLFQKR
ncbi:hypothetical protein GTP45_02490 [Pseudoduganella sp. FT55W]|uniref:Uncharacterized protein n=1 Tax=Duganella rivi TaxID=2666083 RepID=A0A7X4GMI5_9BURK|nr:hypothetical protein [Duganella rivi]MYM65701.1 hypothetical protein [Duganella rivi]